MKQDTTRKCHCAKFFGKKMAAEEFPGDTDTDDSVVVAAADDDDDVTMYDEEI